MFHFSLYDSVVLILHANEFTVVQNNNNINWISPIFCCISSKHNQRSRHIDISGELNVQGNQAAVLSLWSRLQSKNKKNTYNSKKNR